MRPPGLGTLLANTLVPRLVRDAMFAAVMIIANGLVGASILIGALRHRERSFRIESAGPGLAALVTLVTLVLVMLDVLRCPRCGGRRRIVGVYAGGPRLRARLGLGDRSPRPPPQPAE